MKRVFLLLTFIIQFLLIAKGENTFLSSSDKVILNKLVNEWSDAHNDWDLDKLKKLYGPDVLFYCQQLKKEECITKVSRLFDPKKVFHQSIASEVGYNINPNGVILASFTKDVTINNKTKKYPSYLLFFKKNVNYLIVGESDKITDKKLKFKLDVNKIVLPKVISGSSNIEVKRAESRFPFFLFLILFSGVVIISFLIYIFLRRKNEPIPITVVEKNEEKISTNTKVNENLEKNDDKNDPKNAMKTPPISNETKGRQFEDYIVKKFKPGYFNHLEWRGDKFIDGYYAKSNLSPDLLYEFKFKEFSRKFSVECKYKSNMVGGKIEIEDRKFKNYKQYEQTSQIPVYLVFGIGGNPDDPKDLYLIPLSELQSNIINLETLNKHSKANGIGFFYRQDIDRLT